MLTSETAATPPTLAPGARRRAIVSSVIGNGLEWFDFGIYGVFAVIIARLFFPVVDPATSLLYATASFGVAFVVRPLGGIVLGIYADRAGRKAALTLIILLMATGTGLIGVIPTYAAIGIAAPILMIAARMLQGFSAGGEFASATAMLLEFSPRGRRGFIGSFQMCSQAVAFALGGGIAYVLTRTLTLDSLEAWGWRVPFLLGALIGPIGFYIRSRVDESPEFLEFLRSRAHTETWSLGTILTRYPRQLASSFGIVVVGTVSSYVVLIYIPLVAAAQMGIPTSEAQFGMFAGALCLLVLCPLAGMLSDVYGRRAVMLPAVIGYGIAAYPLLSFLVKQPTASHLVVYEIVSCTLMAFFWGPSPAALAEAFPVQFRSTGISIVYNLGVMIFGGLAPFFNAWLTKITGNKLSPAYYIEVSVVIGVIAILLMTERLRLAKPALST
jgi:MFS family permease